MPNRIERCDLWNVAEDERTLLCAKGHEKINCEASANCFEWEDWKLFRCCARDCCRVCNSNNGNVSIHEKFVFRIQSWGVWALSLRIVCLKIINNSLKVLAKLPDASDCLQKHFSSRNSIATSETSYLTLPKMKCREREEVENIKNSLNSCLHNMEDTLVWSFSDIITYLSSLSHKKIPIKTRSIQFPNQNPIDFTPPRATHIRRNSRSSQLLLMLLFAIISHRTSMSSEIQKWFAKNEKKRRENNVNMIRLDAAMAIT